MVHGGSPAEHEATTFDPFAGGGLQATGPTTEAQREILAAIRMDPMATLAYQEAVHITLRGALDADVLEEALREVHGRHGALRSTFSSDDEAFFVWERDLDLRRLVAPPDGAEEALSELLRESVTEPLDVLEGPLFRAVLLRAGPERFHLVLIAHHLVCDGWSYGVLIRELSDRYRARLAGRSPSAEAPPDFVSYAIRERDRQNGAEDRETLDFWKRLFHGSVPSMEFTTDRPRPAIRTFPAGRIDTELDAALVSRLRTAAATCETSLFGLLLSAFYAFLGRVSGQSDLVVAVPAAGQIASGMDGLVGHCVNVLPLRVVTDETDPVPLFAGKVTSRLAEAFRHQDFTVGRLLRTVNVPRDPSRPPVAPVMFNLDRAVHGDVAGFAGLDVSVRGVPRVAEYFEIFLNLFEHADGLSAECQFNSDLFTEGTISEWLESYVTLLRGIAADPRRPVSELPWVPARTLAALGISGEDGAPTGVGSEPESSKNERGSWQGIETDIPEHESLPSWVEATARRRPDAPAVRWSDDEWSYGQLVARAADLSHGLVAAGIQRGDRVAVCLGRGGDLPAGLLAVMGSGAAYVPLDLRDPTERLRRTLQDAGAAALLTDASSEALAKRLGEIVSIPVLPIHALGGSGRDSFARTVEDPEVEIAYVIYTSGSTGVPKGVQVSHRALANFLLGMTRTLDVDSSVAIPVITTLSFDISILEIFLPLVVGGTTLPLAEEVATDPRAFAQRLRESGATLVQATPSTWAMLVDAGWAGGEGIDALAGGETLSPELADRLLDRVGVLWNMYGPTETTVWSACHRVARGDAPVPLGSPVANTVIHVLDASGRPVPAGVPGEILIGGRGVASGYLDRPELTTSRFVPDPTGRASTPFYRTGDLGKWGTDGRLRFLGRVDDQVKIRGHRVELGEVESALESHPSVSVAAAALVPAPESADARLMAWVELRAPTHPGEEGAVLELRRHLKQTLPGYMMPEHIACIDRIPRSAAGKVDRDALPVDAVSRRASAEPASPPATPEARFVANLWAEILGLDDVSLDDDFFALGGHSILAVRVVTRVDRHFGIDIGFRTLFEAPTLRAFVEEIDERVAQTTRPPEAAWEEWVL